MNKIRKKIFLFCLLCIFVLTGLTACSGGEEGVKVNSANALARKLASDSAVKINVSKDIVLDEPIVVNGEKEIVGNGTITAAVEDGEELYMITVANGGKLTVGGSAKIDAAGLMGGIHVQDGGSAIVQDKAVVKNASEVAANALVEGSFEVKGGSLTDANGHNIYNKKETVISGGEIIGSGSKYAGIYNEGTLSQTGGSISKAYNNVSNVSGSTFTFEGGTNSKSTRDGVFVAEGAKMTATKKEATIDNASGRGILLHGQADIKAITVKECGDTLVKVGKNGVLNLMNGILQSGNYHGVDNAGTMTMAGGIIQMNSNCGIVNTGTLKVTAGSIANNANKGILNKHAGTADVTSAMVTLTANKTAIANEDKAVFEFAKAKIMMSTQTNIYCYDGTINLHDASLNASTSNNVRVIKGTINMKDVEVKGNSQSSNTSHHGIIMDGGVINAENVTVSMTTGHGMRIKGGKFYGKNIKMHDINRVGVSMGKHDYLDQEGLVDIDGLEIQSTNYANVWNEGGGTVKVKNAKLAVAGSNSVRVNDGRMELTNVTIPGHKEGSKDNIHGIYMEGGELVAKNVTVSNTSGNALRNKNGKFIGTNIKMTNIKGQTAISNLPLDDENKDGIIEIDGLTIKNSFSKNITLDSGVTTIKNATLGATGGNNIKMQNNAATLNLYNVKVEGQHDEATANTHGIMVEGGNVFGENIQIYNTEACGIRCKLGKVALKNVTMTDIGQTAISNSKMVKDEVELGVGNIAIEGLTVTKVGVNNIAADAGVVSIKDGVFGIIETKNHSIKSEGTAVVALDNVEVQGVAQSGRYGIMAQNGDVILNDVTIDNVQANAIHVNRANSKLVGTNVTVKNSNNAVYASNGEIQIDNLVTSGINNNNILADGGGKISVINSDLNPTVAGHNVKAGADGLITLNNVKLLGVTDGSKHVVMAEGGDFDLTDVEIIDAKNVGIRINRATSSVTGKDVTIKNAPSAITGTFGTVTIDGLITENIKNNNIFAGDDNGEESEDKIVVTITNGDLCKTTSGHNVKSSMNGKIVLEDVVVKGISSSGRYGVIVEKGSEAILTNVTIQDVIGTELSAIYSNNAANKVTGTNITIKNTTFGLKATAGTININGLATEGVTNKNIYASGTASITVENGELCRTGAHNVHSKGPDSIITLNTVDIAGTTSGYVVIAESGGDAELTGVTIADAASHAIHVNNAASIVTGDDVTITNAYRNVYTSAGEIKLTNSSLGATSNHNVLSAGGKITLEGVEVLGTNSSSHHGVLAEGGAVDLKNVTITGAKNAGIRANRDSSLVTGEEVTITNSANGITSSAGKVEIDGLTTTGIATKNIYAEDNSTATIKVTSGDLCKTSSHNVHAKGSSTITLVDTKVKGTGNYAVLAEGGDINLTNVEISDAKANETRAALKINNSNSSITGQNIKITDSSLGLSATAGTVNITGLTSDATIREVEVTGGDVTITDVTADYIYTTKAINIGGVIKAEIYNDGAITLNATSSLKGSAIVMDWPADKVAVDFVGIEFKNADDAKESKNIVLLGDNTKEVYAVSFYGKQMVLKDINNMPYTVTNFDELKEAVDEINTSDKINNATITIEGNIIVTEGIVIAAGNTVAIQDDETARIIKRDADYHGNLFTVETGASLTLTSSSNDNKEVKLTVDGGSKDGITNTGGCSLVGNNGTLTVYSGVKLANNTSSGNNRGLGIYASAGSTTEFSGILENIVGTYRTEETATNGSGIVVNGATVTLDGAVIKNNSTKGSGVIQVVSGGTLNVLNSTVEENTATNEGAAIFIDATAENKVTVENSTFKNNTATGNGGAIANYCPTEGNIVVETSTFTGNEANEGGAITVGGSAALTLADCTFSDNTAKRATSSAVSTAWGNDIRLGGAGTKLKISGKMKAEIFNRNKSVISVVGALTDGSDVVIDWSLDNKVPSNNVGITFSDADIMNASKEYITLGAMQSAEYVFKFAGTTGTLVKPIVVTNETELKDAIETIFGYSDKTGFIELTKDFTVSSRVLVGKVTGEDAGGNDIIEGINLSIVDNGAARTITRASSYPYGDIFHVPSGATLTLSSTSKDNKNPTLTIDGGSANGIKQPENGSSNSMIQNYGTVVIGEGVQLANVESAADKQGFGIYSQPNSETTFGGVLKNIKATNSNAKGAGIVVKGKMLIKNALIEGNNTKSRGTIRVQEGNLTVMNTTFKGNETGGQGAVIFVNTTNSKFTIDGCTFDGNTATSNGGAISIECADPATNYVVRNSIFKNNVSGNEGGAINLATGASITLESCEFTGNQANKSSTADSKCGYGDIRVADNRNSGAIVISGKMIVDIYFNQAGKLTVAGELTEGSKVVANWRLNRSFGNSWAGINFASAEVTEASKGYIELSKNYSDTYELSFSGTTGTLVKKQ